MRRIGSCFNDRLIKICQHTVQLNTLDIKLKHYLPTNLQQHCRVGSFNHGCLLIVVENAAWASQLRYSVPELRDKLRGEAGVYQLSSIKISIETIEKQKPTKPSNHLKLSAQARRTILSSGDKCEYQPLKDALLHLALGVNKEDN